MSISKGTPIPKITRRLLDISYAEPIF